MTNLIDKLKENFSNEIKNFGITEVFFFNDELYTTSKWALPLDLVEKFENELKNKTLWKNSE